MKPKLLNGKVNKYKIFESIIIKFLKIFFMKVKFVPFGIKIIVFLPSIRFFNHIRYVKIYNPNLEKFN